jgi:hypothetical protein
MARPARKTNKCSSRHVMCRCRSCAALSVPCAMGHHAKRSDRIGTGQMCCCCRTCARDDASTDRRCSPAFVADGDGFSPGTRGKRKWCASRSEAKGCGVTNPKDRNQQCIPWEAMQVVRSIAREGGWAPPDPQPD